MDEIALDVRFANQMQSMWIPFDILTGAVERPYPNTVVSDKTYEDNVIYAAVHLFHTANQILDAQEAAQPKRFKIIQKR